MEVWLLPQFGSCSARRKFRFPSVIERRYSVSSSQLNKLRETELKRPLITSSANNKCVMSYMKTDLSSTAPTWHDLERYGRRKTGTFIVQLRRLTFLNGLCGSLNEVICQSYSWYRRGKNFTKLCNEYDIVGSI